MKTADTPQLLHGTPTRREDPVWDPLLELLGDDLTGWMMWMGEVRLEDGALVQLYKHVWTRRYIHLADDGRTFFYVSHDRYMPAPLETVVAQAYVGDYPDVDEALAELDRRLNPATLSR